jgi:hypothetical protein
MHILNTCKNEDFKLVDTTDNGNKYIIRYNSKQLVKEEEKFKNSAFVKTGRYIPTGFTTSYMFITNRKPSLQRIKALIFADIDAMCKDQILNGMLWNGHKVWLNSENQKNYSDWYLLANNEDTLPSLVAKFTKNGKTVYYEFSTKEEIKSLYTSMVAHISNTINKFRKMKDDINWDEYKMYLEKLK